MGRMAKDEVGSGGEDVDLQLIRLQKEQLFNFKVLLLGAGESGKSTVVKQLRLIHKKKLTDKELELVATSLHQNVVDCFKALLQACQKYGLELDEDDRKTDELLNNHQDTDRLTPDDARSLFRLWKSEPVQEAYKRRSEYWLLDSFGYYIDNLERFCEPNYIPSEEDSVMARIRTTGIVETKLEQKIAQEHPDEPDQLVFRVVDVGGQRNERKKWIHCFDDVKAILFCVNLAGYNQVLFEDNGKNRMYECLDLFHTVTNNQLFAKIPIFLFLNKKDLFESMIREVDLKKCFPDYNDGKDMLKSLAWIEREFKSRLPDGKDCQIQVVSASYKRDIRCAFEEVKKALYDMNRKDLLERVKDLNKQEREIIAAKRRQQNGGGCCIIL